MSKFKPNTEVLPTLGGLLEYATINTAIVEEAITVFKQDPPVEEFLLLTEAIPEEEELR